jgi:hypothetical protein
MVNGREKELDLLTPCVSLIIFIKPEIKTGDIGERRDSGQLKKHENKNQQIRHSGISIYVN